MPGRIVFRNDPAVQKSLEVACELHKGGTRIVTGGPYIGHPMAVGFRLQRLRFGPDQISAGLLHDTVEETGRSFKELARMLTCPGVDRERANRIVNLVRPVSIDPSWPQERIYEWYCDAIEECPMAIPIAIVDRSDNLRAMHEELILGYDVFGPKALNRDPNEELTNCLAVIAACTSRALEKDRRRVNLLADEAVGHTIDIRRLLARRKNARK